MVERSRQSHRIPAREGRQPARACALAVLRRVFEHGAWADQALHAEARRLRLDPRERALATRLAYGAVQRRATLDHLIETLRRAPRGQARAARRWPRCGSGSTSSPTWTGCRRTRPWGSRSSWSSATRPAARSSSTPCCGAARARPRRASPRSATPRRPRPRCATRTPSGSRAVVGRARPGGRAGAAGRGQRAGRGRPARRTRCAPTRPSSRRALPVASASGARPARGARARRAVRRVRLAAVAGGPLHAAVARRDDGRAAARAAARRPRARPVRRAGRQDDPPRGADGRARARWSRSSAMPAAPTRCTARPRAWAPATWSRSGSATPPPPHERAAYDRVLVDPPCSDLGTLAARPDARWRKAPDLPARLAREQAAILRAGRGRAAPGRDARLLDLHDLAGGERGRGRGVPGRAGGLRAPTTCAPTRRCGSMGGCRGFLQTLPHRDGTDGFFIARLRREAAS